MESEEVKAQEVPESPPEQTLLQLEEQYAFLHEVIKRQIDVKDEQLSCLHKELEGYRRDIANRQILEVMKQLTGIRSAMKRRMQRSDWDTLAADRLREEYSYLLEDLTDLLERQDIDPFETEPGSPFNAACHSVSKIISTEDPALDKMVKESIKEGYTRRGTPLVPERVVVYKYEKKEIEAL